MFLLVFLLYTISTDTDSNLRRCLYMLRLYVVLLGHDINLVSEDAFCVCGCSGFTYNNFTSIATVREALAGL